MKTATRIKILSRRQVVWRLSTPLEGHKHVVTSYSRSFLPAETYIFGANKDGDIKEWTELSGSRKGFYDHEKVLTDLGYEIVHQAVTA